MEKFAELDTQVLVVDPHESYRVKHFLRRAGLSPEEVHVPMLADPAFTVSATYGVAFQMQIHTEWSNRPATFVVDKRGVLRYAHRGRKYADRPNAAAILEEIKKIGDSDAEGGREREQHGRKRQRF